MRRLQALLVTALILMSCSKITETPPPIQKSETATPKPSKSEIKTKVVSELDSILIKYEDAVDELLKSTSAFVKDMDDLKEKVSHRQSQTDEQRVQTLEAFIDRYVLNMRKYLREKADVNDWYRRLAASINLGNSNPPSTPVDGLSEMEKHLGLTNLPAGESMKARLERIDEIQREQILKKLFEKRKTSTLKERAALCIIRTRQFDWGFIRYREVGAEMIISEIFDGTGERRTSYAGTVRPGPLTEDFTKPVIFSDEVQKTLSDLKYEGKPKVSIAISKPVNPEDNTHIVYKNWRDDKILIATGKQRGFVTNLVVRIKEAKMLHQKDEIIVLEAPLHLLSPYPYRGTLPIENIGLAKIKIEAKNQKHRYLEISILSLASDFPEEDAKLRVDADTGELIVAKK